MKKLYHDSLGVKLGGIDIQNIFIGSTPISKLFLGAELLGGKAEPYFTSKVPQTQFRIKENSYLGIGNVATLILIQSTIMD